MCGLWGRSLLLLVEDLKIDMTTPRVISLASGRQGLGLVLPPPHSVFLLLVPGPLLHLGHLQYLLLRLLPGAQRRDSSSSLGDSICLSPDRKVRHVNSRVSAKTLSPTLLIP